MKSVENMIKLTALFLLLVSNPLYSEDRDSKLGEKLEDCPKGCECITDTARGRFDKNGIIKIEDPTIVPAPKETTTKEK